MLESQMPNGNSGNEGEGLRGEGREGCTKLIILWNGICIKWDETDYNSYTNTMDK